MDVSGAASRGYGLLYFNFGAGFPPMHVQYFVFPEIVGEPSLNPPLHGAKY